MPDYLDEVAELLNEGLSLRKASRRVGRHHKTVAYALRRAGIEIPQSRITCETKNEIETLLRVGAMSQSLKSVRSRKTPFEGSPPRSAPTLRPKEKRDVRSVGQF